MVEAQRRRAAVQVEALVLSLELLDLVEELQGVCRTGPTRSASVPGAGVGEAGGEPLLSKWSARKSRSCSERVRKPKRAAAASGAWRRISEYCWRSSQALRHTVVGAGVALHPGDHLDAGRHELDHLQLFFHSLRSVSLVRTEGCPGGTGTARGRACSNRRWQRRAVTTWFWWLSLRRRFPV